MFLELHHSLLALFRQISADTKDLDDIPRHWLQAQRLHLPAIPYTARYVRSGLLFWAFADQRSASASTVFASPIQQAFWHLATVEQLVTLRERRGWLGSDRSG